MPEEITAEESARRDWEAAAATAPKIDFLHMSTPDLVQAYENASNKMEAAGMEQFVHADLAYSAAVTEMQRRDKLRDAAFAYLKAHQAANSAVVHSGQLSHQTLAQLCVNEVEAHEALAKVALWYAQGEP